MSLWSEIHTLAKEHPEGPVRPIALAFLGRIPGEELVDLIADAISSARRHEVRQKESEAFSPITVEPIEVEGFEEHITALAARRLPSIPREQFVDLLDRTFALSHRRGERVTWGEATVDHHKTRIAMLVTQIDGTMITIDRHRQAIALIEQEQVACLNAALRLQQLVPPDGVQ